LEQDYTHMEPGERIESVAGHYTMESEFTVEHGGRRVLVVLGHTIIDGACCGAGGCRYAFVPGFVIAPRGGGRTTRVEPIDDTDDQRDIEQIIHSREIVQQVIFG
jgi:hypothetical protein